jgi:hypothetical protein
LLCRMSDGKGYDRDQAFDRREEPDWSACCSLPSISISN